MTKYFISVFLSVMLCSILSGCASWFVSDITKLDIRLTASGDLNPDISGRPSPLVVRLYELKAPSIFENADFYSLYDYGKETLGPDFVEMEELTLKPGEQLKMKLALQNDTNYIAILGAYRDMNGANWRRIIPMSLKNKNRKNIVFSGSSIDVLD
ncbi:type VI secretion system lipoprotein TssJ [Alkalimarinus alittae]|uniref:Type VI secretion system lipoprotein TssJ n=1 Tax=Alkalimarinus alittae TaxID=2961619 RepID=A0ABY6N5I0_9ALTE|nr:type VI secretion system lipoprotein TssJ [Alkalimarinus alittae]UZE97334.1 type VI secretion system lipoprotein TssJ [Alkalimarinus alittae]